MSPLLFAIGTGGLFLAAAACVALLLGGRTKDPDVERRLGMAAATLRGEAPAEAANEAETSIFRRQRTRSAMLEGFDRRFCMLEGQGALAKAVGFGCLAAVAAVVVSFFMQLGMLTAVLAPAAWVAGGWSFLTIWDARVRTRFIKLFPEIVDQVVRLARTGLPAVEAIAVVAQEAQEPVKGVLQQVSDEISSGLDPEVILRGTAARLRIPEFTLFSAALCLQRSTGGGISAALGNLSATLRARMEVAMKVHAATAQTRITLWVLAVVPAVVLSAQRVTNPQATAVLFETESGAVMLRWGVGLIIVGLLVARGIAARFGR